MVADYLTQLSLEDKKTIEDTGIKINGKERIGSFFQVDGKVEFSKTISDAIEITSIEDALENIDCCKKYLGKAFKEFGKSFPLDTVGGYFIRVKEGNNVELPVQSCLFLKCPGFNQRVHNVIVVEDNASLTLITGCSASEESENSCHLGISEFFVGKNAYLNSTMIHSWNDSSVVRPMAVAIIEEGGTFISNYVSLDKVKDILMCPGVLLKGNSSKTIINSIVASHPNSIQDIGGRAILKGKNSSAEISNRSISFGGKVKARGHLKAETDDCKGHIDCKGLLLNEEGEISALPEIESNHMNVELSHEAAIGKIKSEEIEYLQSRGVDKKDAESMIVRGFMKLDRLGLPKEISERIKDYEDKKIEEAF